MRTGLVAVVLLAACGSPGEGSAPDAFVTHAEVLATASSGVVTGDSVSLPIATTQGDELVLIAVTTPSVGDYGDTHFSGPPFDPWYPATGHACDNATVLWALPSDRTEAGLTSIDITFDSPLTFEAELLEVRGVRNIGGGGDTTGPTNVFMHPGLLALATAGSCTEPVAKAPFAGHHLAYFVGALDNVVTLAFDGDDDLDIVRFAAY